MPICVDASIVVKWLVSEEGSEQATRLLEAWAGSALVAPAFMPTEVASTLRKKLRRGEMTVEEGEARLARLAELGIDLFADDATLRRAWALAARFEQPTLYDAVYLAVAERAQAEFWTADGELVRRLGSALPYVRLLGRDGPTVVPDGADPS